MSENRTLSVLLIVTVLYLSKIGETQARQQFTARPQNHTVIQGSEVVLRCRIRDREGPVQWAYDGRPFGHVTDYSLPGYPRYSMVVNEEQGQFDFKIAQATLPEDDAKFECQVLGEPKLRGAAMVTVIAPPESPRIHGVPNGTVVEMVPGDARNFTCVSNNGKPAAAVKWLRNGRQLTTDVWNTVTDAVHKRENARSMLLLRPNKEDNGIRVACEAHSQALPSPLYTAFYLSVLYAPGPPSIHGYTSGKVVRQGDAMRLVCVSHDGNPLASLRWKRNGVAIDLSFFTLDRERLANNPHNFTARAADNDAVYRCEATNAFMERNNMAPLTAEVRVRVHFPPASVEILGHDEVTEGGRVNLTCVTANSNPPAEISWIVDGRGIDGRPDGAEESVDGGYVTRSSVTLRLREKRRSVVVYCQAVNAALGQSAMTTKTLTVVYPPNQPTILGYSEGATVVAGQVQRLICMVVDGNPQPEVTWWRDDVEQTGDGVATTTDQNAVSVQLTIVVSPSDNSAVYRCRASNAATEPGALETNTTLAVHFPPYSVAITSDPEVARADNAVTLTCRSASSNPAAEVTWLKNGRRITATPNGTHAGDYGGTVTTSFLRVNLTADDDQSVVSCRAKNALLAHTAHQDVTLNVLYPPTFAGDVPRNIDVIEDAPLIANYSARANPADVAYQWKRDGEEFEEIRGGRGEEHVRTDGRVMKVLQAYRNDTAVYTLSAQNSEGTTAIDIAVNVMYAAKIVQTTSPVVVRQGAPATLECDAEGNPMPETIVAWSRAGYDMSRARVTPGRQSTLTVDAVAKEDAGAFACEVFNGIGESAREEIRLVVLFSPIIDRSPRFSRAASENGATARLLCVAQGHPEVSFSWSRGGAKVNTTTRRKFEIESRKYDDTHFESILRVAAVTPLDYGEYACLAQNSQGAQETTVRLGGTSRPDAPYALAVVDKSFNSVKVTWTPGFDGGLHQAFRVRYRRLDDTAEVYHYVDVYPTNATEFLVPGLERNTEYELSVMAYNRLGDSGYQQTAITTKTASEIPAEAGILGIRKGSDKMPILLIVAIAIIGAILLAINIMLVIYFVKYRRGKKEEEAAAAETDTKSNTVEMYSHVDDLARDDFSESGAHYGDRPAAGSRGFYLDDATLEQASIYHGTSPTYKTFRDAYAAQHGGAAYKEAESDVEDYSEALRRQQYGYGYARGTPDPYTTYSRLQSSQANMAARSPSAQADRIRNPPAPPMRSTSHLGGSHQQLNGGITTMPTRQQPRYVADPTSRSISTTPYTRRPTLPQTTPIDPRCNSANPYSTRPAVAPPSPPLTVRPHRTNPRVTPRAYDYVDVSEAAYEPQSMFDVLV
ncbi:PREDICTED: nephrin-like isoform X1 [Priapulus caudatus]|uniref:Nephrin-like isoform X1 n=1 Tax=Priapulus caudatus TaxID=37621 RepID=A0ABM1E4G7_PRICU|nr:PREDICTED: nephrin-like isoform X1 [Priapulus caudatus]